jgi:hypothetical protein
MPNLWPCSHIFAALTAHDTAEGRPARCRADPLDLAGNPCFPALLCQRIGRGGAFGERTAATFVALVVEAE